MRVVTADIKVDTVTLCRQFCLTNDLTLFNLFTVENLAYNTYEHHDSIPSGFSNRMLFTLPL